MKEENKSRTSANSHLFSKDQMDSLKKDVIQTLQYHHLNFRISKKVFLLEKWRLKKIQREEIRNSGLLSNVVQAIKNQTDLNQQQYRLKNDIYSREFTMELKHDDFSLQTIFFKTVNRNFNCISTYIPSLFLAPEIISQHQSLEKYEKEGIQKMVSAVVQIGKEREILAKDKPLLEYLCYTVQHLHGINLVNLRIFNMLLLRDPLQISEIWWSILMQWKVYDQSRPFLVRPKKVKAYQYTDIYCMMCNKYSCHLHFDSHDSFPIQEHKDLPPKTENHYETQWIISEKQILELEGKINWALQLRCNEKEYINCCHNHSTQTGGRMEHDFQQWEVEFVRYFQTFRMKNQCFIAFMLQTANPNTVVTCYDIRQCLDRILAEENSEDLSFDMDQELNSPSVANNQRQKAKKQIVQIQYVHKFLPCNHEGDCTLQNCGCIEYMKQCTQYCSCPSSCQNQHKGCECVNNDCHNSLTCQCYLSQNDCDPDLCKCCARYNLRTVNLQQIDIPVCQNTFLQYNMKPRLILSHSLVCDGVGVFAGQNFNRFDIIGEYKGEIITTALSTERMHIYGNIERFYLFNFETDETEIDSYMYGNQTRYINHGHLATANAGVVIKQSQGFNHIILRAEKDIQIGDEIFFDYGESFLVDWKKNFDTHTKQWDKNLKKDELQGVKNQYTESKKIKISKERQNILSQNFKKINKKFEFQNSNSITTIARQSLGTDSQLSNYFK